MPKIFTLTGNLLAQTTLTFSEVCLGKTKRAQSAKFSVGGKGVNVARFLSASGLQIFNVVFAGGDVGRRCLNNLLQIPNVKTLAQICDSETREGFVLRSLQNHLESTFLGVDAKLSDDDFKGALELIFKNSTDSDILAICGSIPDWSAQKFAALKSLLDARKLRLVIDTYGAPLLDLSKLKSEILKINADEFGGFLNAKKLSVNCDDDFIKIAQSLNSKFVAITDGANPAMLYANKEFARLSPKKLEGATYPTGCGDKVCAMLILALAHKNECLLEDLKIAMDAASDFAKLVD